KWRDSMQSEHALDAPFAHVERTKGIVLRSRLLVAIHRLQPVVALPEHTPKKRAHGRRRTLLLDSSPLGQHADLLLEPIHAFVNLAAGKPLFVCAHDVRSVRLVSRPRNAGHVEHGRTA